MLEFVFWYSMLLVLILVGIFWYIESRRRGGRRWLLSKGEVVPDLAEKDSVRKFSDPDIERIDLKEFSIDRRRFYRMRVHLRMDVGISFELTSKKSRRGKVYEPGEGETGVDSVDKLFWTESPDLKVVAQVLGAPKVQKNLNRVYGVHTVHVMGDEIEIVLDFRNELLERIYDFVVALTHAMMDQR